MPGRDDRRGGYGGGGGEMSTHCLRMQGIPFSTTEAEITRFFQEGRVTPVRMHRKANGGQAFVEFSGEAECKQALLLHKQYIGSRYIELNPVPYEEVAATVGLPSQQAMGYGMGGGAGYDMAAYGYGQQQGYSGYGGHSGGGGGYGGGHGGYAGGH